MAKMWYDFFPYVQPFVPGCPESVIESHIAEAAKDFCARSEVWRTEVNITTVDGTRDYHLNLPTLSLLENVLNLTIDGVPLIRVTTLHYTPPNSESSKPTHFTIVGGEHIRFFNTPDQAYEVTGEVSVKPSDDAFAVDNYIFSHYGRAIACGALAKLMAIPNKEWSDTMQAPIHEAKFLMAADVAKGREKQRSGVSVRPVRFA